MGDWYRNLRNKFRRLKKIPAHNRRTWVQRTNNGEGVVLESVRCSGCGNREGEGCGMRCKQDRSKQLEARKQLNIL